MILLLDVSAYQPTVDWERVKRSRIVGTWVKATEGASYVNPRLHEQVNGARAAGLRVGLYHYAKPDRPEDAVNEAAHFAAIAKPLTTRRDLRPVLDMEYWGQGMSAGQMVTWARTWNGIVRDRLNAGPIFYSYPDFVRRLDASKPIGYGLWLASYDRNDGHEHPYEVPKPWKRAVAHQFTSRAKVAGVTGLCDLSSARSLSPLLAHPVTGRV